MYNWSIDEEKFAQKDSQGFELWKLEQTINFGQPQDKLSEDLVRKYWDKIKQNLDPYYRDFLELLLWPK